MIEITDMSAACEVASGDASLVLQGVGGVGPADTFVLHVDYGAATLFNRQSAVLTLSALPVTLTGLVDLPATVFVRDAAGVDSAAWLFVAACSNPPGTVTLTPPVPPGPPVPVTGCQDEYADNYDPTANTGGTTFCTYTPRWRSAWQPMAVAAAAQAGQVDGFIAAELRLGFRPGHPLAADRPLGAPIDLRATVGPDGFATFVLGPYLRDKLGAPDGAGGYRYDLNSFTAYDADLYVGYELRRAVTQELLEHGYALLSAVPDVELATGNRLTPFRPLLPIWPGFDDYQVSKLEELSLGQYADLMPYTALDFDTVLLPCPNNPLPVAWLAPSGGYGFWVFQGRPQLGDSVGDGQSFREASSGQQRYSDPGDAYQTFKASSGVFKGDGLLAGLRTLWRSPQAWAQLEPGGDWVPIFIPRGDRDLAQLGVRRRELPLNFSLAAPEWAQGQ